MGGWSEKTKLILISTLLENEVELGKNCSPLTLLTPEQEPTTMLMLEPK